MGLSKKEIIEAISLEVGGTHADSEVAFKTVLDCITKGLVEDGKVTIVGFGTFEVRNRAERKGRNPQTGEELLIPASKSVAFRPSKNLKKELN